LRPSILNFGSCNIDHVYTVDEFVNPGETLSSKTYQAFPGGKGLNQSIAISEAGGSCSHVGRVGRDGEWLKDLLTSLEVNTDFLTVSTEPTGHAIIQINQAGENAIITHGGANHTMTQSEIDFALEGTKETDFVLIQNEIKNVSYIIERAKTKGLQVAFNAAPINKAVEDCPLEALDLLFLNEIEAEQLSGTTGTAEMIRVLSKRLPETKLIITLGGDGSIYHYKDETLQQIAIDPGQIVNTTGAGDAFVGTFLAFFVETGEAREALMGAAKASAKCISRKGATNLVNV
jgi:ribokinase